MCTAALIGCAGGCAGLVLALDSLTCAGDVAETSCCCSGSEGSEACCRAEPDATAVSSAVPAPVLPDVVTRTIEIVDLRPWHPPCPGTPVTGWAEPPPAFLVDCSFRI